ncbi:unnamed protein product [Caenorhabditis bovis]|uniref:PUM-HD domain-containing protein n=1 Tax=Caenorhabditis bovis TaxID=2654633 RepID=A0A8S1ESM2_9PELO|nr:unnamed protein product [Caenorhabditis bovis]
MDANGKLGRNSSQESESSGSGSAFQNNDLSFFNGSFDMMFQGNFPLFNLMQENIFSPKPYVKSENCRLAAVTNNENNAPIAKQPYDFRDFNECFEPLYSAAPSVAATGNTSFVGNMFGNVRSTRLLPSWAVNSNGHIRSDLTLFEVMKNGALIDFAMDRTGVKFLEQNYPSDPNNELHILLFEKLTEQIAVFSALCRNSAGNFIVQRFVEFSNLKEQERLVEIMCACNLADMCLDKFACRVVQQAVQKFDLQIASRLAQELRHADLLPLCTDQCSIHVIQRIVKTLPINTWDFFVKFLCRDDNLMKVCQDKYGCRLVQQTIDKLSDNPKSTCFNTRLQLLHGLMTSVTRNCYRLASNEFANYVVQYVIKSSGIMEVYRDTIIEKCLLRNLLSMSQDKYASHVVEGAFLFAPPKLLCEMMDEIFDGYVKDQETNRDALDILLFHQYGNYVVQQMISLCTSALLGKEERRLSMGELSTYAAWFDRIRERVNKHAPRLERFSSGKKIIESLAKMQNFKLVKKEEEYPLWALPPSPSPLNDVTASYLNRLPTHSSVFDD